MASTAKMTPRLNPMVGAELGPVIAARKPILIGSDCAIAGFGNENAAAPSAPVVPNKTSRRETAINSSRFILFRRLSLPQALVAVFSAALFGVVRTGLLKSNLSLMWTHCPELPHLRPDIAENRLAAECRGCGYIGS
jgi:hypothetical protein